MVRLVSKAVVEDLLRLGDALLVAAGEGPLLDALGADEAETRENAQMIADAGLRHAQLACDEKAADAVLHQIAVLLGREIPPRALEPLEDLQAARAGQRGRDLLGVQPRIGETGH